MHIRWFPLMIGLLVACTARAAGPAELPALNIDLRQTTVSGISSGAYMAVQMGVVKSSFIRGVAATAGGPFLCTSTIGGASAGSAAAVRRCMQGDPSLQPVAGERLVAEGRLTRLFTDTLIPNVKALDRARRIDPLSHLSGQSVWLFHGYNDAIVRQNVAQALESWYTGRQPDGTAIDGHAGFVPPGQVFHKDSLNAAHAQVTTACSGAGAACQSCSTTGGNFLNTCADRPPAAEGRAYDAAGSALQMFYGPLRRTDTARLSAGSPVAFAQGPYLRLRDGATPPAHAAEIAMAAEGYLYVPKACAEGQACRLHIAFHGCLQSAAQVGRAFVDGAGVNEWADAHRIVVLYPQATPTNQVAAQALSGVVRDSANPMAASSGLLQAMASYDARVPFNPMGCWDWWGYNDDLPSRVASGRWLAGTYATDQGVQIAAVWRMAERLAGRGTPGSWADGDGDAVPRLTALDQSARQALLRWGAVAGARQYKVYRQREGGRPRLAGRTRLPLFADRGLEPQTDYLYTVRAVVGGRNGPASNTVRVTTSPAALPCDPYFSLAGNRLVDESGRPTSQTCP